MDRFKISAGSSRRVMVTRRRKKRGSQDSIISTIAVCRDHQIRNREPVLKKEIEYLQSSISETSRPVIYDRRIARLR